MPSQDVVIEVLDARCPRACSNPLIAELRGDKPVHPRALQGRPRRPGGHAGVASRTSASARSRATTDSPAETRKKIEWLTKDMAAHRGADKDVRALICGVPNVGKSTLINTLAGKAVAKVSDKPSRHQGAAEGHAREGDGDHRYARHDVAEDRGRARRVPARDRRLDPRYRRRLPDDRDVRRVVTSSRPTRARPYARYKRRRGAATPEALLFEVGKRRGGLQKGGAVDLPKAADHPRPRVPRRHDRQDQSMPQLLSLSG